MAEESLESEIRDLEVSALRTNAPAATRALHALRILAGAPGPMTAANLARQLGTPRSSTYHLLAAMADEGFVVHYPEEEKWGLGLAVFEVGSAYLRHDPMERLARPLLAQLITRFDSMPLVAHLAILHGHEVLYLLKESGRQPLTLITDVGVRLPASLTASGRAMLARLPAAQLRASLPPNAHLVDRTGSGPTTLRQLRELLNSELHAGFSEENGFITEGVSSVAVAVIDQLEHPVASIGLSFRSESADRGQRDHLVEAISRTAAQLSRRIHGN